MGSNIDKAQEYNRIGVEHVAQGELDEAREAFAEAIRLNPNLSKAYSNSGVLHTWEGELDTAIALHKRALRLDSDSSAIHTNLGVAYAWQGQLDEAIAAHEEAGTGAEALNNLGVAYYQQGRRDEAMAQFSAAIEAEDLPEAHTNLSAVTDDSVDDASIDFELSLVSAPVGVPAV